MNELYGWAGNVLHVDLTDGSIKKVPTLEYEPEKYLGGMGLNFKIFWEMGCPKVGALDPENPLIIGVGPLTGLPGPFSRAEVCSISPQAYPEELFTYSGFGGKWPSELKYAGYDAIVVTGRAKTPAAISIQDDEVEILEADHLWGLDTYETQRVIMRGQRGASVLCMGQAGENLSRNAIMANETGSSAGQGGFGAVMGSKNLKAISVRGTGSVQIARPAELIQYIADLKARGVWMTGASQIWAREPLTGGDIQRVMVEQFRTKFGGCFGCPYQCQGFYDMPGVGKGRAMCVSWWWGKQHDDPQATWHAQMLSQKLGINQFDLVGIWMLLKEIATQDLLTREQWEQVGLPPIPRIWGGEASDEEFNSALMHGIADGSSPLAQGGARGFAQILAEIGPHPRLKERLEVLFAAYGQAAHYFGWLSLALHVAMDTRDSGDSTDAVLTFADASVAWFEGGDPAAVAKKLGEYYGVPAGTTTYAHPKGGEVEAVYEGVELQTAFTHREHCLKNSLPACNFAFLPDQYYDPPELDYQILASRLFSLVTGIDLSPKEIWEDSGDRIWNLGRAIMIKREGRRRESDTLPDALFDTVWREEHPATWEELDTQLDRDEFEALKTRYYELVGWSAESGWPTRARLEALDMGDVADELEAVGMIG
jgi:aldehyde:ferredoxin oxidoreductase